MATATAGIRSSVRQLVSRSQREAQQHPVLVINVSAESWRMTRNYQNFEVTGKHLWTPEVRCKVCGTEESLHGDANIRLQDARAKWMAKPIKTPGEQPGIGPHEFEATAEQCALCRTGKDLHPKGGRYSVTVIRGATSSADYGDDKKVEHSIYADEIARDIIAEGKIAEFGVFMAAGDEPTERELAEAEAIRDKNYLRLVSVADAEWMRYHRIDMIPDIAKRAAAAIGAKKEWLYADQGSEKAECPVCFSEIHKRAAICRHCGAVLDKSVALEHGISLGQEAPRRPRVRKKQTASPSPIA